MSKTIKKPFSHSKLLAKLSLRPNPIKKHGPNVLPSDLLDQKGKVKMFHDSMLKHVSLLTLIVLLWPDNI